MFTSHDLTKLTEKEWEKIRKITETAEKHDFTVIWTVADEPEYVEQLREKYDFLYEVYYADELEIKPIVRSNPGLIWLDNGLVKDKHQKKTSVHGWWQRDLSIPYQFFERFPSVCQGCRHEYQHKYVQQKKQVFRTHPRH